MNLNEAFQVQLERAEKQTEKKSKPRKAALCTRHGGPKKILRQASQYVENEYLNSSIKMNEIFEKFRRFNASAVTPFSSRSGLEDTDLPSKSGFFPKRK
jgi:hypothetical protein